MTQDRLRLPSWLRRMISLLTDSVDAWVQHRSASKGAALAFYTLFSMTPILVMSVAIAGYFFGVEAARGEILSQIRGLVGPNGATAIQALLASARNPGSSLLTTVLAAGLLLVGATSVFVELKSSLDELWGTGKSHESGISMVLRTRLLSFGLVLVLAFLLLVSLVISAALAVAERYAGGYWRYSAPVLSALSSMMSYVVITCLFAVIYKMLPEVPLSWGDVMTGAICTAGLFILGKYGIGLYLGNSGVASGFGAAGSLVALLLWVYYSAQIFFLGAEFTRLYALSFGSLRRLRGVTLS